MGAELCITPPVASLPTGTVVGGRYEIEAVLAYGAMGVVYRARHLSLGNCVAVKAMRAELVAHEEYYRRFADEARHAALLRSDHVARVFDFGRLPSGEPYLVMELLEGADLAEVVARKGPLSVPLAVRIARQACEALAEAHGHGIVHRDLKPENLFLAQTPAGEPVLKILDFGVSKRLGPQRQATLNGSVGSPSYMAPEQLRCSRDVDHRVDIWALGVVLHELLSGRPAFAGETVAEICTQVLTTRPVPLVELRPEVGRALSRVISRCLEPDRARRYASAEELSRALAFAETTRDETTRTGQPVAIEIPYDEIPGVRPWRLRRMFGAVALLGALAALVATAQVGPRRALETVRQVASRPLLGDARVDRIAQVRVDRPARSIERPAAPPPSEDPTDDEAELEAAAPPVTRPAPRAISRTTRPAAAKVYRPPPPSAPATPAAARSESVEREPVIPMVPESSPEPPETSPDVGIVAGDPSD